jgi:Right handed beta helix region
MAQKHDCNSAQRRDKRMKIRRFTAALAAAVTLPIAVSATGPASPWSGKTWLVATNGLDSATCGPFATPCRSITQAIANAADGDTVLVRPGLYGDLNNDGALGGPGEERSSRFIGAVELSKRVRLLSTDGAEATTIDLNGATTFDLGFSGVAILAAGAQFGERGAGFTVTGANAHGIQSDGAANVLIAGNILRRNGQRPDPTSMVGININTTGFVEVRDNVVIDNPSGGVSLFSGGTTTGLVSVHDNVVTGSNFGEGSTGITVGDGNPHLVYRNVITDNSYGLAVINGAARITNNLISGNRDGVIISGFGPVTRNTAFVRNSFIGNVNYGLYITAGMPPGLSIRENNFYGNGSGCGIASQSANSFEARNNYWGAATGPSSTDPADGVCAFNGPVNTTPFATREFQLK